MGYLMKIGWFVYAIAGMISLGIMTLIFKQLLDKESKPELILAFVFGLGMVFYLIQMLIAKTQVKVSWTVFLLLVLAAFLSYIGNLFVLKSLGLTPNPGYTMAIVGLNAIFITLASLFLFGSKITLVKIAGVVCALLGLMLLAI